MKLEKLGPVGPKELSVFSLEKNGREVDGITQEAIPRISAKLAPGKMKEISRGRLPRFASCVSAAVSVCPE
jgi:hypothetical protein